jgi:hypothetical protein
MLPWRTKRQGFNREWTWLTAAISACSSPVHRAGAARRQFIGLPLELLLFANAYSKKLQVLVSKA